MKRISFVTLLASLTPSFRSFVYVLVISLLVGYGLHYNSKAVYIESFLGSVNLANVHRDGVIFRTSDIDASSIINRVFLVLKGRDFFETCYKNTNDGLPLLAFTYADYRNNLGLSHNEPSVFFNVSFEHHNLPLLETVAGRLRGCMFKYLIDLEAKPTKGRLHYFVNTNTEILIERDLSSAMVSKYMAELSLLEMNMSDVLTFDIQPFVLSSRYDKRLIGAIKMSLFSLVGLMCVNFFMFWRYLKRSVATNGVQFEK